MEARFTKTTFQLTIRRGAKSYKRWRTESKHRLENGKIRTITATAQTRQEAEVLWLAKMRTLEERLASTPTAPTLAEYLPKYLNDHKRGLIKDKSLENIERMILNHVPKDLLDKPMNLITSLDLQLLFNDIKREGRMKDGGRRHLMVYLNNLFRVAAQFDVIPANPMDKIKIPSRVKSAVAEDDEKFIRRDTEILRRFLAWLETAYPEHYMPFALLYYCGVRSSELLGLSWDVVQGLNRKGKAKLRIEQTLEKDKRMKDQEFVKGTKNGEIREVPIPEPIRKRLLALKAENRGDKCRNPKVKDQVCLLPDGKVLTYAKLNSMWHHLLNEYYELTPNRNNKNNRPKIRLHRFRHVFASQLISKGVSETIVRELLGHNSLETTIKIYTHISTEDKQKAIERL